MDETTKFNEYKVIDGKLIPKEEYDKLPAKVKWENVLIHSCVTEEVKRTPEPEKKVKLTNKEFLKRMMVTFVASVTIVVPTFSAIANHIMGKEDKLINEGKQIKEEQLIKDLKNLEIIKEVNGEYIINEVNLYKLEEIDSSPSNVSGITNFLESIKNEEDNLTLNDVVKEMTYSNGEHHYANANDYFNQNGIEGIGDFRQVTNSEIIKATEDGTISNTTIKGGR